MNTKTTMKQQTKKSQKWNKFCFYTKRGQKTANSKQQIEIQELNKRSEEWVCAPDVTVFYEIE